MSIFSDTVTLYGEEQARTALCLIERYCDEVYPQVVGRPHPEMSRAKRMCFAAKLLECMAETGTEFEHICHCLNSVIYQAAKGDGTDPTIYYATTPRVLGYWLLMHKDIGFESVAGTQYQPVESYF